MDFAIFSPFNKRLLDKSIGGYEWWYTDFIDAKNEISGVIIFYYGNLFSPKYVQAIGKRKDTASPNNFPAISLSLYKNGKPLYYSFLEYKAGNSHYENTANGFKYQVGQDWIAWQEEQNLVSIHINQKLADGTSFIGDLVVGHSYKQPLPDGNFMGSVKEAHNWLCVMPHAEIHGVVHLNGSEIFIDAVGYHDHNAGSEPLHDFFTDWYWGRAHFPKSGKTLVYYAYIHEGNFVPFAWLIDQKGLISHPKSIKVHKTGFNLFGLRIRKNISIDHFYIKQDLCVDNGPFYVRYLSTFIDDLSGEQVQGFTEYIRPKRIHNSFYHPLVNLRLRYADQSPNAVQRSSWMYPLTWKLL